MLRLFIIFLLVSVASSCQKEIISFGEHVSETFFVESKGASMPVLVEGNTKSSTFLLFVHGGPGSDSQAHNTNYISEHIEDKYACVYWDQRNSGASQGGENESNLTIEQMTDDLKKVIQVLRYRYGQNISVFICGHSFGGLLTSSFMTTDNYQSMVNGWIFMDGSHDYRSNFYMTREMLMAYGNKEIKKNNNKSEWEKIVNYCESHSNPDSYEQATQMNVFAHRAGTYFDIVAEYGNKQILDYYLKDDFPITSAFVNVYKTSHSDFCEGLESYEFTSSLYKVNTPTLILFGEYDFICPPGLGYNLYDEITTADKKIVISPISSHYFDSQDPELFCNEVNNFIETFK